MCFSELVTVCTTQLKENNYQHSNNNILFDEKVTSLGSLLNYFWNNSKVKYVYFVKNVHYKNNTTQTFKIAKKYKFIYDMGAPVRRHMPSLSCESPKIC